MKIDNAKTKQDIIPLFHSALLSIIPANQLDRIARAILTKLLVGRQQALPDPLDVPVNYSYNAADDTLTSIEIDGETYDINRT